MIPNPHELLHPKEFFAALWPYRFSAMAFGHCNAASKKWRAIYAIVVTSASFLPSYTLGYEIDTLLTRDIISDVEAAIANLSFYFHIFIVPIHVLAWFFVGHPCYTEVVESLTLVDRELEKICFRRVNMKKTVIRQLLCISLELLLAIILIVRRVAIVTESPSTSPWLSILTVICGHHYGVVTMVVISFFGNLVCFVGDRYALINSALKNIGTSVRKESATGNQSGVIFDEVKLTGQLRVVHRELFFVSRKVMDAFAIQMFICVFSSFTFTVYGLYTEYAVENLSHSRRTMDRVLTAIGGAIYDFGVIIYVCYCCHETVREANETTKILNSLKTDSEDLHLEVSSFSYQLMHYQLDFSPFGFYQLDLAFVQGLFGSMATYLIILIQMESTVLSDRESPNTTTTSETM